MFKEIKHYENYGLIDEKGNIKAHDSEELRKSFKCNNGSYSIKICGNTELVKNLVYKTHGKDFNNNTHEVVFIDGDKDNLHISNLKLQEAPIKVNKGMVIDLYDKGYSVKDIAGLCKVSKRRIYYILGDK